MRLSGAAHTVAHCAIVLSIATVAPGCDNGPLDIRRVEVRNGNNRFVDWYSVWSDEVLIEEPLPARSRMSVGFSELVDVERSRDAVTLSVRGEDLPLPVTLDWDGPQGMLVTPEEPMPNGAELQLSLGPDVLAWDGGLLGRTFLVDFRVRAEEPVLTK